MTMRELLIIGARELAAAYHETEQTVRPAAPEELETVWHPGREAPSLIGWRESRNSLYDGDVVRLNGWQQPRRKAAR